MDSVVVPICVTDDYLDQLLYRLKEMPARVFIIHMRPALAIHLLSRAKGAGMMSGGYVWMATFALGSAVDNLSPDEIDYLQGVVTFRPYVQSKRNVNNLSARFETTFYLKDFDTADVHNPSLLLFWAYDTAWATATAAEIAGLSSSVIWMAESDLGRNGVPATRRAFLYSILNVAFDGLVGKFKLVNRELQLPSYEIVNVTSKGAVVVGLWTPFFDNSKTGSGTVKPVFRREDSAMPPNGGEKIPLMLDTKASFGPKSERRNAGKLVSANSGKVYSCNTKTPLRIGIPQKDGFKVFVNVSHPYFSCNYNVTPPSSTKQITGYSIDVFEAAMNKLEHPLCYDFCVFDGTYDQLVGNVSLGNLEGAVGDVTITADRIGEVDFTMPYTTSGVSLLVLSENDLATIQWTFLAPLTKELWIATVGFFFFTAFVVWMIERTNNPEYQGSILRQSSTALYFAFSTLTFSHGHIIRSPLSKIVVVIWCFVVVVVVQSYTASFSSILTTEKLHPSVTNLDQLLLDNHKVGYQRGSFVESFLRNRGFRETRLIPYSKEEEYAEGLRNGSMNGGVSAVADEVPYLTPFLSDTRYHDEFRIVDHIYKTPGFGFVFPLGFPLVHNLSAAILNITGGNEGSQIEAKWLGTAATSPSTSETASTALTLQNFSGLFVTSGFISSLMLLISIVRLVHARWTNPRNADGQSAYNIAAVGESLPPQHDTGNISSQPETRSDNVQGVDGSGRRGGDEESGGVQNDTGNRSGRGQVQVHHEASNDSQVACRNSGSSCHEGLSAVQNSVCTSSIHAQSFQIGANNG